MAHKTAQNSNESAIAKVNKRTLGYKIEDVDSFLNVAHMWYEQDDKQLTQQFIQNASFDLVKGGYAIEQVDAALMRLERAVVDKETALQIQLHGRVAYRAKTENLLQLLNNIASRPAKHRFQVAKAKQPAYDRKQVDELIDNIILKAKLMLGLIPQENHNPNQLIDINAVTISNVIFTQRKGSRGYDERQVDYYLNACIQLFSRMEAYMRYSELDEVSSGQLQENDTALLAHEQSSSDGQLHTQLGNESSVRPLIHQDGHNYTASNNLDKSAALYAASNAAQVGVPAFAGESGTAQYGSSTHKPLEHADDFAALQEAEQAIFISSAAQEVPSSSQIPQGVSNLDDSNNQDEHTELPTNSDLQPVGYKNLNNVEHADYAADNSAYDNTDNNQYNNSSVAHVVSQTDTANLQEDSTGEKKTASLEETQQFNPFTDVDSDQLPSAHESDVSSEEVNVDNNDYASYNTIENADNNNIFDSRNDVSSPKEDTNDQVVANGSLAALAQMAQNLQGSSLSNNTSFEAHIPDLAAPQVAHFVNASISKAQEQDLQEDGQAVVHESSANSDVLVDSVDDDTHDDLNNPGETTQIIHN